MATAMKTLRGSLARWPVSSRRGNATWAIGSVLSLIALGWTPAHAQSSSHLRCQGSLFGAPAVIDGLRLSRAFTAMGDAEVQFNGTVAANGMTGRIVYGGYTNAAFQGMISGPLGAMRIAVLDNTGGRMLIYNGRFTLKAPDTIGQFICAWS